MPYREALRPVQTPASSPLLYPATSPRPLTTPGSLLSRPTLVWDAEVAPRHPPTLETPSPDNTLAFNLPLRRPRPVRSSCSQIVASVQFDLFTFNPGIAHLKPPVPKEIITRTPARSPPSPPQATTTASSRTQPTHPSTIKSKHRLRSIPLRTRALSCRIRTRPRLTSLPLLERACHTCRTNTTRTRIASTTPSADTTIH